MHTQRLVYDNLSFSDICHNNPRTLTASEICFSLGSVQITEDANTVWTLHPYGICKRQLQLSQDVQYFSLWALIPYWELHMNKNTTSANNCFFCKKRKNRITLRDAVVLNRKILLQKMQPNNIDQYNAFNFLHSLHLHISLWSYRILHIFESCILAAETSYHTFLR